MSTQPTTQPEWSPCSVKVPNITFESDHNWVVPNRRSVLRQHPDIEGELGLDVLRRQPKVPRSHRRVGRRRSLPRRTHRQGE